VRGIKPIKPAGLWSRIETTEKPLQRKAFCRIAGEFAPFLRGSLRT